MPRDDARRWDARYTQDERFSTFTQPRPFLVEQSNWLPESGLALDGAMGLGGNAEFLMGRGLRVVGVDISWVALRQAKRRLPELMAFQADLPRVHLADEVFDVIINFYYLQRDLWAGFRRWLRPGGILIFETLTREMLEIQPDTDPDYLLESGELSTAFKDMETLVYREERAVSRGGRPCAVASLVARRPFTISSPV